MEWVTSMTRAKKIPSYKAVFTFESDGAPICRDWVARLLAEWDRVSEQKPVVIAGALVNPGPHINGNAMLSCRLEFLEWLCRIMGSSTMQVGWDYAYAKQFEKIGWADIPGMKSIYNTPTFDAGAYQWMQGEQLIWVHGVKDSSLIQMGRKRFGV
jgi:hypothetical protein